MNLVVVLLRDARIYEFFLNWKRKNNPCFVQDERNYVILYAIIMHSSRTPRKAAWNFNYTYLQNKIT